MTVPAATAPPTHMALVQQTNHCPVCRSVLGVFLGSVARREPCMTYVTDPAHLQNVIAVDCTCGAVVNCVQFVSVMNVVGF